jgi:hypothetical protein
MLGMKSALIAVAALNMLLVLAPGPAAASGGVTTGRHSAATHWARARLPPPWGLRALAPRAAYTEYPWPGYNLFPYGPYPNYDPRPQYPYFDGRYGCPLTYWGC